MQITEKYAKESQKDKDNIQFVQVASKMIVSLFISELRATVVTGSTVVAVISSVIPGEKPTALIDGTIICRSDTSSKSASLSFPALPIRMLRPLI